MTQPVLSVSDSAAGETSERDAYLEILKIAKRHSRIDFNAYREGTVSRRLQRRASICGEGSLAGYLRMLRGNVAEIEQLTRELLIGVTQFFRDPETWGYLEESIIPQLVDQAEERGTLRLWCAGCATGEEAYTLAILIEEHLQRYRRALNYRLFATDVRRDSLRFARAGAYPVAACLGIPETLREKYFETRGDMLVARRPLRDVITFAPHDLLSDPPFTQLHLVTCRNLLIYLLPEVQQRVISRFRMALREGGWLLLGASESVGEAGTHFRPINSKLNVFQARGPVSGITALAPPLRDHVAGEQEEAPVVRSPRLNELLYEAAIGCYVPPGVAVDASFELLQIFGRASDYVSLPTGRMTVNLLKMVPPPLAVLLSAAGRRALTQAEEVRVPEVRLRPGDDAITVRVVPVDDVPGASLCLLIFFEGLPTSESAICLDPTSLDGATQQRIRELEDELLVARENLHSAVQDLEATNEELQATNEELTASNEELQSTNEELQSVNEELYTVNSEYQEKIGELEQLNSDLENLLHVVDAGVLFLDDDLTIRRFNDAATRLLPARHEDIGRPLSEIAIQAEYPNFARDAQQVMLSGQRHLATVRGNDGAWWSIGMRAFRNTITPNGGVIVTMQDISELKRTISELEVTKGEHERAEGIFGVGHAVLDLGRETVQYSSGARALLGLPRLGFDLPA
ncbi:MAG TPA: CheR family methyltransferase, partial [Polyangiaceae bacterium]|nr:CheR family methyltransferase [Polyangiaceae bacterium]